MAFGLGQLWAAFGNHVMKDIIEKLTPEEAEELAVLEARIQANEDSALEYVTDMLRVKDRLLYRATHGTFEDYCLERWGKTSRAIRNSIKALTVRNELKNGLNPDSDGSDPVIKAFAGGASDKSVLAVAKIKPKKRAKVITAAAKIAGTKPITPDVIKTAKARVDHRAVPAPVKPNGFNSAYGLTDPVCSTSSYRPKTDTPAGHPGKAMTLEAFRARVSALNTPATAKLSTEFFAITGVRYDASTNQLVLA